MLARKSLVNATGESPGQEHTLGDHRPGAALVKAE